MLNLNSYEIKNRRANCDQTITNLLFVDAAHKYVNEYFLIILGEQDTVRIYNLFIYYMIVHRIHIK